uniref:Reverse transcriptase domain-containing protein n=1 Tax=Graphocephala atropunctata TaxID=36148 RepID=A0A1B6MJV4_9HEMI
MSSMIVKEVAHLIVEPLTFCINRCIMEGIFPSCLKFARIVPIYKKGKSDEPSSFRPISCIPILAKVLEKILKIQVCQHFENNYLFSLSQFGFRSGKSTTNAVDALVNRLLFTLEGNCSAQVTLCDLSKAFDCVRHDVLLNKLEFYGVKNKELNMFKSYLMDRRHLVDVCGRKSEVVETNIGVPQGSVLGPILFLILINDISCNISSFSTVYADDVTLMNEGKYFADLISSAKNALDEAMTWFRMNGLHLNDSKTKSLLVTLKNVHNINSNVYSDVVKLLGIHIDSRLSWSCHIDFICRRLSRVVVLLTNLRKLVSPKYLKMAYFVFF